MKRYCQTLQLVDDEQMIAKYVEAHAHVWPEVIEGQRQVGILDMQIYRRGRNLFMICDTVDDFDWQRDMDDDGTDLLTLSQESFVPSHGWSNPM